MPATPLAEDNRHPVAKFMDQVRIDDYKEGKPWKKAHLKRDGYCGVVYKHRNELNFFTKKPTRYFCHGQPWFNKLYECVPEGMWFLGELFVPGGESTDVRSVLAKEPGKAGEFEIFYSPHCNSFEELDDKCKSLGLATVGYADSYPVIPPGYEGFVLKNHYHPNAPFAWMRAKPDQTIDLRIVGFEISVEGRHTGKVGAFKCQTDDGRIRCDVGIMPDDVRNDATKHKDAWRGLVIEVKYQKGTSRGSLRHPRFIRYRDDKDTTN